MPDDNLMDVALAAHVEAAKTDYGVVVGVSRYPLLDAGDLEGPQNDAEAFYEWLVDPEGGAVPVDQVWKLVSPPVVPTTRRDQLAMEPSNSVETALIAFDDEANERIKKRKPARLGRRLYIFLAGHGIAPRVPGAPRFDDVALLFANATVNVPHHLLANIYANWFLMRGIFDEVLLFMDCCREHAPQVVPKQLPFADAKMPMGALDRGKIFYGLATKAGKVSRGRPIGPQNQVRGLFTHAVLSGLKGGAAEGGVITNKSLERYVEGYLAELMPTASDGTKADQRPEFRLFPNDQASFVIKPARQTLYRRRIKLRQTDVGKRARIRVVRGGRSVTVAEREVTDLVWEVDLPIGAYLAIIGDRDVDFDVFEGGGADVDL